MNQCIKCKSVLPDNAKFCSVCGAAVIVNNVSNNLNTKALLEAAYYIREGDNVEKNIDLSISMYNKILANEPDNSRALYCLAWCYYDNDDPNKNIQTWLPLAEKAANLGYAHAQEFLGEYYSYTAHDYSKAMEWFEKAAKQDDTNSMIEIAYHVFFDDDNGINDRDKGMFWINRAYEMNEPSASKYLGDIYYDMGIDGDDSAYRVALKYYKEAAINGDGWAAYRLGLAYLNGKGVEKNTYEAVSWLKYGTDLGDEDALLCLASICLKPEKEGNIKIDPQIALSVLDQASEKSAAYCYELMRAYELGKFGKVDHNKADFYCAKYSDVLTKCEEDLEPNAAKEVLENMRTISNMGYSAAFARWVLTPDNDIAGKLSVMDEFQKNIDSNADIKSLVTLACIYANLRNIPRFKSQITDPATGEKKECIVEGVTANHIDGVSNDAIVDYKKAFELLDKGIEWGSEICKEYHKTICNIISRMS